MKCPNCGAEIPENKLYCEACGCELQIVPDFDVDVEREMKHTMNKIIKDNHFDDDFEFDDDPSIFSLFKGVKLSGKLLYAVIGVIGVLAVIAAIFIGSKIVKQNNYAYQIEMGNEASDANDYLKAVSYYENALKLKPDDYDVAFKIANLYYSAGRENDAIFVLKDVIANDSVPTDKKEEAYMKIISLYEASSNYELIAELLSECTNQNILSTYQRYIVGDPSFSVDAGTYHETIALKIECPKGSTVYYTMDGTDPDTNSTEYDSVIFLEYGSYEIKAISVNQYGISSAVVSNKYLIDVDFVFEPDILTESGDYTNATMIEADVPIMYSVYYTTDGSEPSKDSGTSIKYSGPIPMPLGESHFRFISYASDGSVSSIVDRDYSLTLATSLDPATAVSKINEVLRASGHINDELGRFDYIYVAPYPVEGMGDFYFVVEYLTDNSGNMSKLGTLAVDCYNGMIYSVTERSQNDFKLTPYN
jgi:tetratricopeptide (TPR) repeat protein